MVENGSVLATPTSVEFDVVGVRAHLSKNDFITSILFL